MAQHAGRRRIIEAAAVALEAYEHLVVAVCDEGDGEVRLAVIGEAEASALDAEIPQRAVERAVLVDEDRLEQRAPACDLAPALNVHERGVLVFSELQLLRPDVPQQLVETSVGIERHAKRQGVDE